MQVKLTNVKLKAMLAAQLVATEQFNDPKMILITAPSTITPAMLLADVTVATYTGYAPSTTCTWGTPKIDADGRAVVFTNPKEFKPSATGDSETVTHVGLVNQAGTVLLSTYKLDTPIVFTTVEDVHLIGFPLVLTQPINGTDNIIP